MIGTSLRGIVGDVRVHRVDVEGIATHAVEVHGLQGRAAELCTEGVTAAAMLAAHLDEGERLTLQVQGQSPRFALSVEVHHHGAIRARFTPPRVPDVPQLKGMMLVTKSVIGREVYRGATELDHSDFASMLQWHLDASAQAPARVTIQGSRGTFAEVLPGGDNDELPGALVSDFEGETHTLSWECACSRDKVAGVLRALGPTEVQAMIDEDGGAKVTCHYCNSTVEFDVPELQALL